MFSCVGLLGWRSDEGPRRVALAQGGMLGEELHSAVTPSKSRIRPRSQPIIRREYKETAPHSNQSCDVTMTCDAASLVTLCRSIHRIGQGAEKADTV